MKSSMVYYNVDGKHYTVTYMFQSDLDYFVFMDQLPSLNSDGLSLIYKHLDCSFFDLVEKQAEGFKADFHISSYDIKPTYLAFNHSVEISSEQVDFVYGV